MLINILQGEQLLWDNSHSLYSNVDRLRVGLFDIYQHLNGTDIGKWVHCEGRDSVLYCGALWNK